MNGSQKQILLAEVKCFPVDKTSVSDVYAAIGQYLIYRAVLMELEIEYPLYLVIPASQFDTIVDNAMLRVIRESRMLILVVDLEREVIVRWIE